MSVRLSCQTFIHPNSLCYFLCSLGHIWLSGLWVHVAGSCWASCPLTPVFLSRAPLSALSAQCVPLFATALIQVQDLALAEFHEVCTDPPLQPENVALGVIMSTTTHRLVSLANLLRCIQSHVTNKMLNITCPTTDPWGVPHHWSPLGHGAIDQSSLSATIQQSPYSPNSLCFKGSWDLYIRALFFSERPYVATYYFSDLLSSSLVLFFWNLPLPLQPTWTVWLNTICVRLNSDFPFS